MIYELNWIECVPPWVLGIFY